MSQYYVVLIIIVLLGIISLASLYWVMELQKRLKLMHTKMETKLRSDHDESAEAAHTVLIAEELLRLEDTATSDIKTVLSKITQQFEDDLSLTSKKLNGKVEELTDKVIADELTKYQNTISEVRQASIEMLSKIQANLEAESRKNAEDVVALVEAEKKKVIEKFEQKMGDIVAGYLVEILGTNVDLGAQRGYLFTTLEAHKDELKQAISDGT